MKIFYIICVSFYFTLTYGQNPKVYTYYIEMNSVNVPIFGKSNNRLIYQGNESKQKQVFSKYNILSYEQAFPDAIDPNLLNIYVLRTTDSGLVKDLLKNCKDNYKSSEDITDRKIDFLYVPNDFGNTSPTLNLGADVSRKDLDYLNAPDAWEITKGNTNVKIGISDTQIEYTLPDLLGKVTITSQTSPYSSPSGFHHGTTVAALSAAKGDNAHGSVGVCMDCDIVEGSMDIGANNQSYAMYTNLYKMAKAGAKVINMSWTNSWYTNAQTYDPWEQAVINDLVNNYRVTLVAAAGNYPSFSNPQSFISTKNTDGTLTGVPVTPFGIIYVYPASYDNVISVSSIQHKNSYSLPLTIQEPSYCCTSPWFPLYVDLEDSVGHSVSGLDPSYPKGVIRNGYYQDQYNQDGFQSGHTLNEKVDILATGYSIFGYSHFMNNLTSSYSSGTSYAAPLVSGTIGLMLSVNDCLIPKEIESILKLTSKDVESMSLNSNYKGYTGAGKLEIGEAVKFVNESKKFDGNAVINNHLFNRFDFFLPKINNKLSIYNIVFKENCKAEFIVRNAIEISGESDFYPNSMSFIDLKTDVAMDISCLPIVFNKISSKNTNLKGITKINNPKLTLYPNTNNGIFTINLGIEINSTISLSIYDISGKLVYDLRTQKSVFDINLPNLASGLYIVKLQSDNYDETIKFIKE